LFRVTQKTRIGGISVLDGHQVQLILSYQLIHYPTNTFYSHFRSIAGGDSLYGKIYDGISRAKVVLWLGSNPKLLHLLIKFYIFVSVV
jgi:hypothetical protein